MNNLQSQTFNLFTTVVKAYYLPQYVDELNSALHPHLEVAKENYKNDPSINSLFGLSYHTGSILNDSAFDNYHRMVTELSINYLSECGYDVDRYTFEVAETWGQKFTEVGGGHHFPHIHNNTHVNAFYILERDEFTTAMIVEDPRTGHICTGIKERKVEDITPASTQVSLPPTPGTLILIPGYLSHGFNPVKPGENFKFLHTNITALRTN